MAVGGFGGPVFLAWNTGQEEGYTAYENTVMCVISGFKRSLWSSQV